MRRKGHDVRRWRRRTPRCGFWVDTDLTVGVWYLWYLCFLMFPPSSTVQDVATVAKTSVSPKNVSLCGAGRDAANWPIKWAQRYKWHDHTRIRSLWTCFYGAKRPEKRETTTNLSIYWVNLKCCSFVCYLRAPGFHWCRFSVVAFVFQTLLHKSFLAPIFFSIISVVFSFCLINVFH